MTADMKPDLGQFEGQKIAGTTIALRKLSTGLSEAMRADPALLHHGEMVYVVIEARVSDVQHPEIKDSNEVLRKHILNAGTATLIDGAVVRAAINAQADRIQAARDEQTGAQALDLGYDADTPAEPAAPAKAKRAAKKAPKPRKTTTGRPRKAAAKKAGAHLSAVE